MKILKYIDFSAQTLMLVAVLTVIGAHIGGTDMLVVVLWMQLLLGPWQVLSSIISVACRGRLYKQKAIHLFVSAIYLIALSNTHFEKLPEGAALIMFWGPPWTLAIYYYVLTIISTFYKHPRQSSFLPHTSF